MAKKQQKQAKKQKITFKELLKELGLNTAACRECTTKNDVESLFAAAFNGIIDAVKEGRTVKVYGFGNFGPKTYKGRTQRSGLEGVPNGIATFGDVALVKFKLSAMAKAVLAGEDRKVRTGPAKVPAKVAAPVAVEAPAAEVAPVAAPKAKRAKAQATPVVEASGPVAVATVEPAAE